MSGIPRNCLIAILLISSWTHSACCDDGPEMEVPVIKGPSTAVAGDTVFFSFPEAFASAVVLCDSSPVPQEAYALDRGLLRIEGVVGGTYAIVALDTSTQQQVTKTFVVRSPAEFAAFAAFRAADDPNESEPESGLSPAASESADAADFAAQMERLRQQDAKFSENLDKFIRYIRTQKSAAGGKTAFELALLSDDKLEAAGLDANSWKQVASAALNDLGQDWTVDEFEARFVSLQQDNADGPAGGAASEGGILGDTEEEPTASARYEKQFVEGVANRLLDLARDFDPKFPSTTQTIADKWQEAANKVDDASEIVEFRKSLGLTLKEVTSSIGTSEVGIAQQRWEAWYDETKVLLYLLEVAPSERNKGTRAKYFDRMIKKKEYAPILADSTTFGRNQLDEQKRAVLLLVDALNAAIDRDQEETAEARRRGNTGVAGSRAAANRTQAAATPGWYHAMMKRCHWCRHRHGNGHAHAHRYVHGHHQP